MGRLLEATENIFNLKRMRRAESGCRARTDTRIQYTDGHRDARAQRRVASPAHRPTRHTRHTCRHRSAQCPCSARVVHIVEIPHPATQGHAHPSPRRLAVNGRPQRAVPPWRGHLARLRCRRAAWTAACAGLRACESRRSAAPLLVAHHAARPRKESLGAAGGVRARPPSEDQAHLRHFQAQSAHLRGGPWSLAPGLI